MRTLSEAMAALLKSRKMIGADKPSYSISIDGLGATGIDFTSWTDDLLVGDYPGGNICGTKDGKAIISYVDSGSVKVAFADSVGDVITGADSFGAGTTITTGDYTSIVLIGDVLYLVVQFYDAVDERMKGELWTDDTGAGTSFSKKSNISLGTTAYPYNSQHQIPALAQINNGDFVVMLSYANDADWEGYRAYYSTDDGATWNEGAAYNGGAGNNVVSYPGAILPFGTAGFVFPWMCSSTASKIFASNDSGATLASSTGYDYDWGGANDAPYGESFFNVGTDLYMRFQGDIYKFTGSALDATAIRTIANWTLTHSFTAADYVNHSKSMSCEGYIISTAFAEDLTYVAGAQLLTDTLPVKSISINRNKNMAASLELVIDNKDGAWSPDGTARKEILWPNTVVTVQQGYGTDLVTTFKGLIDRISMTSFPQEIIVSCRDCMKYLLDQLVTKAVEGGNTHILQYTAQTVEYIVTDLVTEAGLTLAETIYTTGITVDDITFSWCSWADAIQELADLVGADFGCDETGEFYFRKDYIPDTPTIAYIFQEGEDIISLGYTIDDADIYQKVVCYGTKTDGTSCFAQTNYTSRVYYNVLPHKYMKIDAGSAAQTAEAAQLLTNRAEILMRSRVRICQFAAAAVPQLQIGDVIQVIETSTTISEAYRVTDLSTTMDDTYTMMITCYHHSYTA